ncbi:diheme cytochrome C [filamentous cyanobacterium LEGE 11480]|uniref:Diheme cytochrome C n=1 Tax=Romeriopsis navalis LEGE 11480 TaxID=2777977 RepID=A0A928VP80_9CYAN|nr:diheme cytochrome C [Romeriopsis navalis]MBE9032248.1 diheme cytochrome C [Romeriopsis navalis LEGE 11480]
MTKLFPRRRRHRSFRTILMVVLCLCCGWGFAQGIAPVTAQVSPPVVVEPTTVGTVDPVLSRYQRGQTLYLKNCASCHIALPPAVLPRQTWLNLIQDQEHYGAKLPDIRRFDRQQIGRYLRYYSRPLRTDETVPYRVTRARHFKALHPQVKLPRKVTMETCASCHPKADVFNFRAWNAE